MTDNPTINAAFDRAEAAFERAIQQSLRAQEVEFQKLAEAVLADLAASAVEQILGGIGGSNTAASAPGAAISAAIAGAAARGGRFL